MGKVRLFHQCPGLRLIRRLVPWFELKHDITDMRSLYQLIEIHMISRYYVFLEHTSNLPIRRNVVVRRVRASRGLHVNHISPGPSSS